MHRRNIFTALCFLILLTTTLHVQAASPGRERISLDAGWRFLRGEVPGTAAAPSGTPITRWRYIADEAGAADAVKMAGAGLDTTGADWKDAATGQDTFGGRVGFAWFRTALPNATGTVHSLHFEGVDDNATVYLNGQMLLHHEGWDDPFDADLTKAWKSGGPNTLAVLVENTAGEGGITKPVTLQSGAMAPAGAVTLNDFNDRAWRTVHVPHDFIIEGTFSPAAVAGHGSLPTTTGWYRKAFDLPASDKGRSLWVDFDGVYRDSKVWLNGHFLGRHASGYTSFRYDIAPYANYGGRNVLAVHVDPTHFEGWWYEGGGIYRHVWLNKANPVHVVPWGTFVSTKMAEPGPDGIAALAVVSVSTTIGDTLPDPGVTHLTAALGVNSYRLVTRVVDPAGQVAATAETPFGAKANPQIVQQMTVTRPRLWSVETPRLYTLHSEIRQGSRVIDATDTPFGIRTLRYDAEKGFFLNGKSVKIQGTCNHQDFAGVGIAVPDTLEAWRVKKLKEMGGNGWRMSHNPPTPELLDACDKLGMLVMDENRHLGDSPDNLAEVASMVQRDRNHPSVIMWSMCNEENGQQGKETGAAIFKAMRQTVLQNDPTRMVSSAMNGGWFDPGFRNVEDLMGVNYYPEVYDKFHAQYPNIPLFGSETASTLTTRGEYENNKERVFVSSYNLTEGAWKPIADRPFVAGGFAWTGFDYKGEPTPYQWPDINSHFGILDMCGFPKDNYFYYQAAWKPAPLVHIFPHWNWPGKEGQPVRVVAFSNCEAVELFLNGVSLGRKPMPRNEHLDWTVPYAPGTLLARGYNGETVAATDTVTTTGAPTALRLTTDRTTLTADGEDLTPIEVDVVDAQGRIVPTADNLVTFSVKGAGTIAGVGNGDPGDHDPDKGTRRKAFNGKCLVLVGATEKSGDIQLTATAPGLAPVRLSLRAK